MVLKDLFSGKQLVTDIEKRCVDTMGKEGGGTNRASSIETYICRK